MTENIKLRDMLNIFGANEKVEVIGAQSCRTYLIGERYPMQERMTAQIGLAHVKSINHEKTLRGEFWYIFIEEKKTTTGEWRPKKATEGY